MVIFGTQIVKVDSGGSLDRSPLLKHGDYQIKKEQKGLSVYYKGAKLSEEKVLEHSGNFSNASAIFKQVLYKYTEKHFIPISSFKEGQALYKQAAQIQDEKLRETMLGFFNRSADKCFEFIGADLKTPGYQVKIFGERFAFESTQQTPESIRADFRKIANEMKKGHMPTMTAFSAEHKYIEIKTTGFNLNVRLVLRDDIHSTQDEASFNRLSKTLGGSDQIFTLPQKAESKSKLSPQIQNYLLSPNQAEQKGNVVFNGSQILFVAKNETEAKLFLTALNDLRASKIAKLPSLAPSTALQVTLWGHHYELDPVKKTIKVDGRPASLKQSQELTRLLVSSGWGSKNKSSAEFAIAQTLLGIIREQITLSGSNLIVNGKIYSLKEYSIEERKVILERTRMLYQKLHQTESTFDGEISPSFARAMKSMEPRMPLLPLEQALFDQLPFQEQRLAVWFNRLGGESGQIDKTDLQTTYQFLFDRNIDKRLAAHDLQQKNTTAQRNDLTMKKLAAFIPEDVYQTIMNLPGHEVKPEQKIKLLLIAVYAKSPEQFDKILKKSGLTLAAVGLDKKSIQTFLSEMAVGQEPLSPASQKLYELVDRPQKFWKAVLGQRDTDLKRLQLGNDYRALKAYAQAEEQYFSVFVNDYRDFAKAEMVKKITEDITQKYQDELHQVSARLTQAIAEKDEQVIKLYSEKYENLLNKVKNHIYAKLYENYDVYLRDRIKSIPAFKNFTDRQLRFLVESFNQNPQQFIIRYQLDQPDQKLFFKYAAFETCRDMTDVTNEVFSVADRNVDMGKELAVASGIVVVAGIADALSLGMASGLLVPIIGSAGATVVGFMVGGTVFYFASTGLQEAAYQTGISDTKAEWTMEAYAHSMMSLGVFKGAGKMGEKLASTAEKLALAAEKKIAAFLMKKVTQGIKLNVELVTMMGMELAARGEITDQTLEEAFKNSIKMMVGMGIAGKAMKNVPGLQTLQKKVEDYQKRRFALAAQKRPVTPELNAEGQKLLEEAQAAIKEAAKDKKIHSSKRAKLAKAAEHLHKNYSTSETKTAFDSKSFKTKAGLVNPTENGKPNEVLKNNIAKYRQLTGIKGEIPIQVNADGSVSFPAKNKILNLDQLIQSEGSRDLFLIHASLKGGSLSRLSPAELQKMGLSVENARQIDGYLADHPQVEILSDLHGTTVMTHAENYNGHIENKSKPQPSPIDLISRGLSEYRIDGEAGIVRYHPELSSKVLGKTSGMQAAADGSETGQKDAEFAIRNSYEQTGAKNINALKYSLEDFIRAQVVQAGQPYQSFRVVQFALNNLSKFNSAMGYEKADQLLVKIQKTVAEQYRNKTGIAEGFEIVRSGSDWALIIKGEANTPEIFKMVQKVIEDFNQNELQSYKQNTDPKKVQVKLSWVSLEFENVTRGNMKEVTGIINELKPSKGLQDAYLMAEKNVGATGGAVEKVAVTEGNQKIIVKLKPQDPTDFSRDEIYYKDLDSYKRDLESDLKTMEQVKQSIVGGLEINFSFKNIAPRKLQYIDSIQTLDHYRLSDNQNFLVTKEMTVAGEKTIIIVPVKDSLGVMIGAIRAEYDLNAYGSLKKGDLSSKFEEKRLAKAKAIISDLNRYDRLYQLQDSTGRTTFFNRQAEKYIKEVLNRGFDKVLAEPISKENLPEHKLMARIFKEQHMVVVRRGGEEFAVIIPDGKGGAILQCFDFNKFSRHGSSFGETAGDLYMKNSAAQLKKNFIQEIQQLKEDGKAITVESVNSALQRSLKKANDHMTINYQTSNLDKQILDKNGNSVYAVKTNKGWVTFTAKNKTEQYKIIWHLRKFVQFETTPTLLTRRFLLEKVNGIKVGKGEINLNKVASYNPKATINESNYQLIDVTTPFDQTFLKDLSLAGATAKLKVNENLDLHLEILQTEVESQRAKDEANMLPTDQASQATIIFIKPDGKNGEKVYYRLPVRDVTQMSPKQLEILFKRSYPEDYLAIHRTRKQFSEIKKSIDENLKDYPEIGQVLTAMAKNYRAKNLLRELLFSAEGREMIFNEIKKYSPVKENDVVAIEKELRKNPKLFLYQEKFEKINSRDGVYRLDEYRKQREQKDRLYQTTLDTDSKHFSPVNKAKVTLLLETYQSIHLPKVVQNIKNITESLKNESGIPVTVYPELSTVRVKSMTSLRDKLFSGNSQNQRSLGEMTDLIGGRMIVKNHAEVEQVTKKILQMHQEGSLEILEVVNKYATVKEGKAYRAIHFVIKISDTVCYELQIKTRAELVVGELEHDVIHKDSIYDFVNGIKDNVMGIFWAVKMGAVAQ